MTAVEPENKNEILRGSRTSGLRQGKYARYLLEWHRTVLDQMTTTRSAYIAYIDGMRALAVLAVMLYHLQPSLIPGGFVGVDVFFVISGFVVTASLANHGTEPLGRFLGGFYARRLARLMPALVVMLVVTTLAYVLLVPQAWFNRAAETVGQAAFWGLSNWVLDGHTVNYFEPQAELNPFTHTWSLGVEEQFYLIAPLLLFVALRKPLAHRHRHTAIWAIGVLFGFSLVGCYYFGVTKGARFVFYGLPFRFWELAAGVLLFLHLPEVRSLSARFGTGGVVSSTIGLLLILAALFAPHSEAYPFVRATVAAIGTLLLISAAHANPRDCVRRVFASSAFVWIGQRSYALYIWHWPVYVLARWTVGLTVWPFNIGAVALSFLLAATSYRMIEQPFRKSRRLKALPLSRRIGLFVVLMAGGWSVGHLLLEQQPSIGLGRVTREAADWYGSGGLLATTLAADRACEPAVEATGGGKIGGTRFEPTNCKRQAPSRLFVIGDSHAVAYRPMLEQLSAEEGRTVTLYSAPGCSLLSLNEALGGETDALCLRAAREAVRLVLDDAQPGDIVFFPSLRVPRLLHQGGKRRFSDTDLKRPREDIYELTEEELAALDRAMSSAPALLAPLKAAGLRILLEAPKPVFRAHPYACIEWWNRSNPDCLPGFDERRVDMERFRAPVTDALKELATGYPGVSVWDPLPSLCEEALCSALRDGRPLFFDADHLSPYGNLVLLRPFQEALRRVEIPE